MAVSLASPGIALVEPSPGHHIAAGEQQPALGFDAVPPCPAAFLLIILQRLRHAGMDHIPHVRFVDPHAEGDVATIVSVCSVRKAS